LDWKTGAMSELAESTEAGFAAAGCEAGGDDWGDQVVLRVDVCNMGDTGFGGCDGRFGALVAIVVWT